MSRDLKPGDIASAIRELNISAKLCRAAANDYANHPAHDDIDRQINRQRSAAALDRAEGYERIMTLLAAELLKRKGNNHAG
ncbi:MAG TPA: hypothetical protein PKE26_11015 [Kiritimatiellia bacterium]|nr:hypothetical protein [Kiritimatiellia bacterium]HMO99629.1 hypothetical protein [Kiritimatiellia bacterium]HMP97124.1 hypothetical protein [Kiritimatiellia bacterium]